MSRRRVRVLRHGDTVPEGVEPRRYLMADGYAYLRWLVGPQSYLHALEHRWVMGLPPDHIHVHHVNGVKDDNRPENLRLVTPREHGREHRRIDRERVCELYALGLSTPEIGRRLGCDHSAVYRIVRSYGIRTRTGSEALTVFVPAEPVIALSGAGVSASRIARFLGVSPYLVQKKVRELGLPPHRKGRPSPSEEADMDRAVDEYARAQPALANVNRLPMLRHP